MIRYQTITSSPVTVLLDTNSIYDDGAIAIEGDPLSRAMMENLLFSSFGFQGHTLEEICQPIDFFSAINSLILKGIPLQLIEGKSLLDQALNETYPDGDVLGGAYL